MSGWQSFIIGTLGLTLALCVSAILVFLRPGTKQWQTPRLRPILAFSLLGQAVHFAEESVTGFHARFPELLGLPAWPFPLFVSFNLALLVIWAWGLTSPLHHRLYAIIYWFFALALVLNGVAHPSLSVLVGGYFPGLYSSPVIGILGILLLVRLYRATEDATDLPSPPNKYWS